MIESNDFHEIKFTFQRSTWESHPSLPKNAPIISQKIGTFKCRFSFFQPNLAKNQHVKTLGPAIMLHGLSEFNAVNVINIFILIYKDG